MPPSLRDLCTLFGSFSLLSLLSSSRICSLLKGHPNNVALAIYGGIQLSVWLQASGVPESAHAARARPCPHFCSHFAASSHRRLRFYSSGVKERRKCFFCRGSCCLVVARHVPTPNGLRLVAYVPSEAARCAVVEKKVEMRSLLASEVGRRRGEE